MSEFVHSSYHAMVCSMSCDEQMVALDIQATCQSVLVIGVSP